MQDAQIERELVQAGAQPGQGAHRQPILFARVGLRGGLIDRQIQLLHHPLFQLAGAVLAIGKKLRVAGAGSDRALQPFAADLSAHALQLCQIGEQVLAVLRQPVADRGRFGGLDVGEGDGGSVGLGFDARGQYGEGAFQPLDDLIEGVAKAEGVYVVQNVHRRRAQVNDRAAQRALLGEGADFGHQIVADLPFDLLGARDVDVILARPQIGHLRGRHQPRLILRLRQRHPDAAHQPALLVLAPDSAHHLAAIAPGQRGQVGVVRKCRHGR